MNDRLTRYLLMLTKRLPHPVFVKVGANDGITGDHCGDIFLKNANWSGLLVEPVPYCFEKLQVVYNDRHRFTADNVAIGSTAGAAPFYYVSEKAKELIPDLPDWYDQLGSFDRQHITKHLGGILEPFIEKLDVEVKPLHDILLRHHIAKIDFLHIDTEGYDLQVLKTFDFAEQRPLAIFIEHMHLADEDRQEMQTILVSNGYRLRDSGTDYFAVHTESNNAMNRS